MTKNVIIAVVGLIIVSFLLIVVVPKLPQSTFLYHNGSSGSGVCSMEAMICPDGSAVGRTGPNCSFAPCPTVGVSAARVEDSTFYIDAEAFALVDGTADKESAPGSAARTTVAIFGEPVWGDLNEDKVDDAAVWLVMTTGGSGSFYYVATALSSADGYRGTNALLVGDRVAPQTLEVRDGVLIANYATRKDGEPFSSQPSIGKSFYAAVVGGMLVPIDKPAGF